MATQRTDQLSMSCGNHGTSCGTGTGVSRSAFGEDAQRLGVLLGQLVEQVGKSFVVAHHVLVGILRA